MPDKVAVKMASGYNMISVAQWTGIPVPQRVQLITGGKVQFLANGAPMPLKSALEALKGS